MSEFHDACAIVFREAKDPYAKAYAKAGFEQIKAHETEAIESQCLYMLNNLSQWKGPTARATKEILRRLSKPPKKKRA